MNISDVELIEDIKYITENRDDAIEHLCNKIRVNDTPESIHSFLNTILRFNVQIKTLEDILVHFRIKNAQEVKE